MHRSLASIALAALGLFASPSTATAETITVCASGCDFTSIQKAIDAASNGDVIQLAAETYYEGSVIDTDGKAITLSGATGTNGAPLSILDGGDSHRVLQCVREEGENTVFENLVIRNGSSTEGGGMYNLRSSPTLNDCTFTSNTGGTDGGGMGNNRSSPNLTDCTFTGNTADTGGGMLNFESSPALTD